MRVKTRKVGNSLTVTIPKELVSEMDLSEDTDMNIFVREGAVVLEPVVSRWDRLVARVRDEAVGRGLTESDVDDAVGGMRDRVSDADGDCAE